MMLCLYTPQGYKDENSVDVFDEVLKPWADTVQAAKIKEYLWGSYRYAVMDTAYPERWIQRGADKAALDCRKWTAIMAAYDAHTDDIGDLNRLSKVSDTSNYEDLDGSKDTVTQSGSTIASGTDTDLHEDIPATSGASSSTWLTSRDSHVNGRTDTVNGTTDTAYGKKNKATRTSTTEDIGGTTAEALSRMMDAVEDPYAIYARTWADRFVMMYETRMCDCP